MTSSPSSSPEIDISLKSLCEQKSSCRTSFAVSSEHNQQCRTEQHSLLIEYLQ